MKRKISLVCVLASAVALSAVEPIDLVNTEIGTISHMLVPAFQTLQRPNGMLRLLPINNDFTQDRVKTFHLQHPGHRDPAVFPFHPFSGRAADAAKPWSGTYDHADAKPYLYSVFLDSEDVVFRAAPGEKAAVASFTFEKPGSHAVVFRLADWRNGELSLDGCRLSGRDVFRCNSVLRANVFVFGEFNRAPSRVECAEGGRVIAFFGEEPESVSFRWAVSYIDDRQAEANLRAEMRDFDVESVALAAREAWNRKLSLIEVEGGTEDQRKVFYTSLWRTFERMVDMTEQGRYYGWDGKAHDAGGVPYYNDDWTWDTYRAMHPLMTILQPVEQGHKLASFIRMAQQNSEGWMPSFPSISGDRHAMVNRHAAVMFLDAWSKGIRNYDLSAAFDAMDHTVKTESLVPWYRGPMTELDRFYEKNGYYPGLQPGEKETCKAVDTRWERRQCVSVTQGASYDAWALSEIAKELGRVEDAKRYAEKSLNYRNLWNPETKFFHPKDKDGKFIDRSVDGAGNVVSPFNYLFGGGYGSRDYFTENNAWTYIWDVQHDFAGLVALFGGKAAMSAKLDEMFNTMIGPRWKYAGRQPDGCTGLMGVFTMANEPSFHIPYLYNFTGEPWKTQKLVRKTLDAWFRNDKMGMCGDEDGGGMSAYAVFSMMGFYPVTPGLPEYQIGSPVFRKVVIHLSNGKDFVVEAPNASNNAKYVKGVMVDGKPLSGTALAHSVIASGAKVVFTMSERPEK